MLKIKDNVDLKELEKYGATFYYDFYDGKINEIWFVDDKEEGNSFWFKLKFKKTVITEGLLFKKREEVFLLEPVEKHNYYNKVDLLYDLIQAGLIEKVGESN